MYFYKFFSRNFFFSFSKKKSLMNSLFHYLELKDFISSNHMIICRFYSKNKNLEKKNSKPKIFIVLPFWIGKIFNLSSYCSILIPKGFEKKYLRRQLIMGNYKNGILNFYSKESYVFGQNLHKTIGYKMINLVMKKFFLLEFSAIFPTFKSFSPVDWKKDIPFARLIFRFFR